MHFKKREARKDLYKLVKKFSRDIKRVESFSFSSFKLGWKSKKRADSALRNTLAFVREHHFVLGFLFFAAVAGAMGGLYNSASKKLAARPGVVKAVGECQTSAAPNYGGVCGPGKDVLLTNGCTYQHIYNSGGPTTWQDDYDCIAGIWVLGNQDGGPGSGKFDQWTDTCGGISNYSLNCSDSTGSAGNVQGYAWSVDTGWIKFSSSTPPVGKRQRLNNENQLASRRHGAIALAGDSVSRLFKQVKLSLFGVPSFDQSGSEISKSIRRFVAAAGTIRRQLVAVMDFGIRIAWAQVNDYGVTIDTDGQFSGYAWSDNVGWVYFGPDADLPVYGPIASSSAPDDPKYWAKWSKVKDQPDGVTGWAKILALGDDGWIKMSDDPQTVSGWNGNGVKILSNGDFEGWAWNAGANGSAGIGWISFNASSTGNPPGGPDYKVTTNLASINNPPVVSNLSATHWSKDDARAGIARRAFLWWDYSDQDNVPPGTDPQAFYRVVATGSDGFVYDTNKLPGNATQFELNTSIWSDFAYNTAYRWQVTVWDSNGASTTAEYNSPTGDVPFEIDDGQADTFTTFSHEFPEAKFTWTPANPSPGQSVEFDGLSSTAASGYSIAEYRWDFTNMLGSTPLYGSTASATVDKAGIPTVVSLTVTDNFPSDPYSDTATTTFSGKLKLPSWREVK